VKNCNALGEIGQDRRCQGTLLSHVVKQALLIEAVHFNDSIDQGSRAVESKLSIRFARDGADANVQLGRCPAVQVELSHAGRVPQLRRRVVEIGEADRTFELISPFLRQEDHRGMGCLDLYGRGLAK
jgi:hypothetical protein